MWAAVLLAPSLSSSALKEWAVVGPDGGTKGGGGLGWMQRADWPGAHCGPSQKVEVKLENINIF